MKVIEVKNLSKAFEIIHKKRDTLKENFIGFLKREDAEKETIWSLKDINFDVKKGECIGIVGENASGKTTLLKIIGKILNPTEGEVVVRGKIAPLLTLGVGFDPELTARENVYLYGSIMGLSQRQIDERYHNIVKFSELDNFMNTKLKHFSSGMEVRLGFATAINVDADILLVDEVLSVGDGAFQKKCLDKFEEFKRQGKTIIYVSHGLDSITKHCDKAIFLHKGRTKAFGDTEKVVELYKNHLISKQLKTHNIDILRKIKEASKDNFPYIENLKIFNQNKEESYVLESGKTTYLLFKSANLLTGTIFITYINGNDGGVILFSKNFQKGTAIFKIESLPLTEGNYEISIGCLGGGSITGPYKFKIYVYGYSETPNVNRIFIENPITLDKEVLAFGRDCENVLKDFELGKTLISFTNIDEAKKNCSKAALFLRKNLVFSGAPSEVIESYKKCIYDSTVKKFIQI